jgi:type I restriction enzyme S subunit
MGFIAEPGVPFLKVYNLVNQSVDFGYRPQYVEPEAHLGPLAKSRTLPGDVLMNIVGPPLGKVAIVPDAHDEWNINQAICLFRPSRRVGTEWLYYLLCEGANIRQIQLETKGSAGQVNISLTQCRQFEFPVPSIAEQQEVCRRAQDLFTLADQLEARLTAARKTVDRLTPALLAKAFRGELVPQDPGDEPASALLERIRAARQAEAAASGPPRRGRKKAAANPATVALEAAPAPADCLAALLKECGALSERALLAASELEPARFRAQLTLEQGRGAIRATAEDGGQMLLEASA